MKPSVAWCWAAALLGCGTFEPVDEPGARRDLLLHEMVLPG